MRTPHSVKTERASVSACRARLDLGFLIDGSSAVEATGRGNFKRILNFVKSLMASFGITRSQTRVGAVLFSSRPRLLFGFRHHSSRGRALRAVDRTQFPGGVTRTGRALSYAGRSLFGRRRRGRKQVLLVVSGRSVDGVSRGSSQLKRRGVEIFSLGLGKRYSFAQLRQMATSKRNVFTASVRSLLSLVRLIKERICAGTTSSAL